jgi:hypothetical protein
MPIRKIYSQVLFMGVLPLMMAVASYIGWKIKEKRVKAEVRRLRQDRGENVIILRVQNKVQINDIKEREEIEIEAKLNVN